MSFITRCPACSTSFKVVADQLRVSQGWVRCGHCADIFDANQDLKPWVPTPPVLTNVVDDEQQPSNRAWAQQSQDAPAAAPSGDSTVEPDTAPIDPLEPEWDATQEWAAAPVNPLDTPAQDLPIDLLPSESDALTVFEPQAEPRFVQQAKRQAFWDSWLVRVVLWLGVLLGLSALLLQWAVHDRHRLAAWQPALKPVLSVVCQPLGCSIGPVQQLDAVVIDSSALVRLLGQLHALDVVLKNTQAWPVALPSLELSLNDAQEQVLVRRVLLVQDWPDAPEVLAAGESWPLKLRLSIALPEEQTMSGYRLALFYP